MLTEAITERGENISTIRSFTYESAEVPRSHISAIVELAKKCTHLTTLNLSCLSSGFDLSLCQAIASILESKNCMLRELYLFTNHIKDEGCRVIAESLRINRRLRLLSMDNDEITDQGLASFIPVVCDTSSIESTLNPNHTLEAVARYYDSATHQTIHHGRLPADLIKLLDTNKEEDKKTAASLKVLRCHFNGDFDLTAIWFRCQGITISAWMVWQTDEQQK